MIFCNELRTWLYMSRLNLCWRNWPSWWVTDEWLQLFFPNAKLTTFSFSFLFYYSLNLLCSSLNFWMGKIFFRCSGSCPCLLTVSQSSVVYCGFPSLLDPPTFLWHNFASSVSIWRSDQARRPGTEGLFTAFLSRRQTGCWHFNMSEVGLMNRRIGWPVKNGRLFPILPRLLVNCQFSLSEKNILENFYLLISTELLIYSKLHSTDLNGRNIEQN